MTEQLIEKSLGDLCIQNERKGYRAKSIVVLSTFQNGGEKEGVATVKLTGRHSTLADAGLRGGRQ